MSDNKDQIYSKDEEFQQDNQPLLNSRSKLLYSQEKVFYISGIAYLIVLFPTFIVLLSKDDTCEMPIREWLIVISVLSGIYVLIGTLEVYGSVITRIGKPLTIPIFILTVFQIVWFIIGSVWLFDDPSGCSSDWPGGYIMTLVLLAMFYVQVGIVMLVGACCCCCLGVVASIVATSAPVEEN